MEGGVNSGGGGGAGGLRTSFGSTSGGGASNESKFSVALSTSYTVTVGSGGTPKYSRCNTANKWNDSVLGSITSTWRGRWYGGGRAYQAGANGGSGGWWWS